MGFLANFVQSEHVHMLKNVIYRMKFKKEGLVKLMIVAAIIALGTASCSKKSGCPGENAQTEIDKNGKYKKSKTTSGLGLVPAKGRKKTKS